jgi:S-(hydroxymethyl)glutathione dehydrogenase / alcohol dehydrogenase
VPNHATCRLGGAERVLCDDLAEERLELARGQGATETLIGGPDVVERVLETTAAALTTPSRPTGDVGVMRQAVESVRMGWGMCFVTGVAGRGDLLELVPRLLITGRRLTGCELGGIRGRTGVAAFGDR